MSLIALTARLRAGRSTARWLLLLIAITGAVIIGLLAMHSLNSHSATDASDRAGTAVVTVADMGHTHSAADDTTDLCADCGSDHSSMLAMACVLALLAVALLLLRPNLGHRWLSTMPRPQPVHLTFMNLAGLRPPCLTALCISRT
ncbi:hypothetical protein JNB63_16960 [Microbacterium trichothecenolyticum]|uniref:DUF2946 domain-containing protein n=1 Tax=Microbacterium ureisolvens TaxID=2781186 RepID=A0ABS7I1W1_9MICO|nr:MULTISPECIES: DUF6153 family protein [Microbacterium]MBW9111548.1 hypothetical protein [Microbacterium ureisolvens]MBW9121790.1 hypothetical protein [Microbacterium trichothecenolyticum]